MRRNISFVISPAEFYSWLLYVHSYNIDLNLKFRELLVEPGMCDVTSVVLPSPVGSSLQTLFAR